MEKLYKLLMNLETEMKASCNDAAGHKRSNIFRIVSLVLCGIVFLALIKFEPWKVWLLYLVSMALVVISFSLRNSQKVSHKKSNIFRIASLVVCGIVFLVLIKFAPWGIWLLYLVSLALVVTSFSVCNSQKVSNNKAERLLTEIRDEVMKAKEEWKNKAEQSEKDSKKKEEYIKYLEGEIKKIQEKTFDANDLILTPFVSLLEVVQSLDSETKDFGEECQGYVHDQVSKALSRCGLHFEDYSEEYADCYKIDIDPKIEKIEYLKRAVLDRENHLVAKGYVFIPDKKNNP